MRKIQPGRTPQHPPNRRGTQVARLVTLAAVVLCACTSRTDPLARIRDAGMLRIAIDPAFPPFEFVDGTGTLVGLDVDLGRQIATRLDVEAHFVTTGYDALYDALTVGRADVILSALYPDPSRMQNFVFTRSYFNAGAVLIVPETASITASSDLAGKRVALVFGTDAHVEALRWEKTLHPAPTLLVENDAETAIAVLSTNQADAALIDHVTARIALAHTRGLRVILPPVTDEPYVVATRVEDAALIDEIDEIIKDLQSNDDLDALIEQWMQ